MASPTSSASPADKPAGRGARLGKQAAWVSAILFILVLATGEEYMVQIPVKLLFGWYGFTKDNLHAMQPNRLLIAEGVACVVVLAFGGHYFMRWLWAQMAPAGAIPWRAQWTLAGLGALLLLFVAGIATIGVTHQAAWVFTDKTPFTVVEPWADRVRVNQAILGVTPARNAVAEYFAAHGKLPESSAEAGFQASATADGLVKSVAVGAKGVVNVELHESIAGGGLVTLTPTIKGAALEWKCGSNLPRQYMPGSCREPR